MVLNSLTDLFMLCNLVICGAVMIIAFIEKCGGPPLHKVPS